MDFRFIFVVLILYSFIIVLLAQVEQHATLGKETDLTCRVDVTSASGMTVLWFSPKNRLLSQNSVLQTKDERFSISMPYHNEYVLKLTRIQPDDAGIYVCQITAKPTIEKKIRLMIDRPPVISQQSPDMNASLGDAVTLSCAAEGPPIPEVRWFRYTFSGSRIDQGVGKELTIDSVSREHAGDYECVADNGISPSAEKRIRLDVLCAPEMRLPYKRLGQTLGHDTLMTCIVSANPAATVTWSHGDVVLTPSDKYAFNAWDQDTYTRVSGVLVRNIEDADYGEYTCSASNSLGETSLSMTVDSTTSDSSAGGGTSSSQDQQVCGLGMKNANGSAGLIVGIMATVFVIILAVVVFVVIRYYQRQIDELRAGMQQETPRKNGSHDKRQLDNSGEGAELMALKKIDIDV